MSSNSGNQQSRRTTSVQQALAEDKAEIVRKFHSKAMPVIDENDAGYPKQSRANIGISQLSIPLVWNSELHFKSKGDSRTYSMFAVLQTKTKVVDSRMITNIDRTVTDVVFPESYVFESEPDDFCIEVSLFAARTDQGLVDSSGSLRSKITRSLGRKFGTNVKTQLATLEFNKMRGDSILGGTHFNLLARAYLVLPDAGEDCKIHDLKMSAFADLSGPPLYGHIMCRMAVQPLSVLHPLVEGMLTVKPLGENTALKNVQSRLQAGNLTCYMNVDVHKCPSREEVLMQIPITSGSKIVSTAYPYTFLLATEGTTDAEGSELFVTADNEKSKDAWKRALEAQITDCEIWGNFAYTPTKLTHEKRKDPVKETLSRASGNTLYDKISITGTISKGTAPSLSPSFSYCPRNLSPLQTDISKTAPSRRNKQRTNVLDIFPNPAPSESPKNSIQENDSWGYTKESSAVYTPMSTRMRDPMAMDYSSLSRYDTYSNTSSPYLSGKKSWSRSIGEFIGKKINTPSVQVTSPKVNSTMRLLLLLGLCGLAFSFSCKDQDGKDVDWWAVYKMPIEQDNSVPGISQGVAWYYVDVNKKGALLPSQETLNSKKQAIAYTLQQYYDVQNDPTIFHVMYNDEPYVAPTASESWFDKISNFFVTSNSASVQKGHTKGVSFFNKTNGVWYVHSVPLFPPPDHYEYPDSGHIYGQTMLCMSFKYSELAKIGTQLYYNNPQIYSSRLPSNMAQDNPDLAKIIGNQHKSGAPQSSIVDLTTVGGSTFKSFAKTNEFNNDLYDGLIAPMLKTNLYAETWRRGSVIPVNCQQPYFTLDAQNMKIGNTAEFSYTKDHTKMARSVDATKPYVCIGDINRMQSQYSRGGGSECISSTFLWNAFNVFVDTNSCPAPGKDFLRGNRVPIN